MLLDHTHDIVARRQQRARRRLVCSVVVFVGLVVLWVFIGNHAIFLGWSPIEIHFYAGSVMLWVHRMPQPPPIAKGITTWGIPEDHHCWLPSSLWNHEIWTNVESYEVAFWPALMPAAAWLVWSLLALRRRTQPSNHCVACGYDLTDNVSGVCPECGTPFREKHEIRLE